MLRITEDIKYDESVVKYEFHSHRSYSTLTFAPSDEIKIAIRQQDICTLPSESYIYIEGSLTKEDGSPTTVTLINNCFAFLFEEIRYEIGGVEIDRNRNCGITSTLKGYCSYSPEQVRNLQHGGWILPTDKQCIINENGNFSAVVPLRTLLGFAEDYDKIIVQMPQELILTRSKSDTNAVVSTGPDKAFKLSLSNVCWCVPYVTLSDEQKIKLYKVINNDSDIRMAFRSWELFEYPVLGKSVVHNWSVKTSSSLEKPRYVIIGFQTNRKETVEKSMSQFDHCNIRSVRVWLNSEVYPYEITNIDFQKNNHVIYYNQYLRFKKSYYDGEGQSLFTFQEFTTDAPLFVVDCSKQNESVKSGSVDIRIELLASKDFPEKTSVYALIINEKIVEYSPSRNLVRKL